MKATFQRCPLVEEKKKWKSCLRNVGTIEIECRKRRSVKDEVDRNKRSIRTVRKQDKQFCARATS